jgi:hypothetical protein
VNEGIVDTLAPTLARGPLRGQFNRGPMVTHLELEVERALQGSRRCRRCAAVHGRYVCIPSAAVRNEWRHGAADVELIAHLLTCQPDSIPRLQAMILVKKGSQLHARAVYSCELPTTELQDGPWTLHLITEKSECDFVFPGEIEIASGGALPTSRLDMRLGNGR